MNNALRDAAGRDPAKGDAEMSGKSVKRLILALLAAPIVVAAALFALGNNGFGPLAKRAAPDAAVAADQSDMRNMNMGNEGHAGQETAAPAAVPKKPAKVIYRCPMHPSYTSDRPGQCPICGMNLVADEATPPETPKATGEATLPNMPKGFGMVSLSREKAQLIGIRTAPATRLGMTRTIKASATVAADERRIRQVQSKIQGWIDKLYVNFNGQYVSRGQALMAVYSPDLVSTQEEYLLAMRNLNSLQGASPEIREGAQNLVDAAKRRLEYWDISSGQIRRLEQSGQPLKTLTLYSPVRGYVTQSPARQGMQVTPGAMLYTIADLSQVWVLAGVHEQDLALISKGMQVVFRATAYPGRDFTGKVSYINPQLDPQSRTATARIELANPDMALRPEMYGEATLVREIPGALSVPASAVMDNGEAQVVYVQTEPGRFAPRAVKVGIRTNDSAQILDGLEEGELVVVDGNFMLDSESRLRASASEAQGSGMEGMSHH